MRFLMFSLGFAAIAVVAGPSTVSADSIWDTLKRPDLRVTAIDARKKTEVLIVYVNGGQSGSGPAKLRLTQYRKFDGRTEQVAAVMFADIPTLAKGQKGTARFTFFRSVSGSRLVVDLDYTNVVRELSESNNRRTLSVK